MREGRRQEERTGNHKQRQVHTGASASDDRHAAGGFAAAASPHGMVWAWYVGVTAEKDTGTGRPCQGPDHGSRHEGRRKSAPPLHKATADGIAHGLVSRWET
jgi:hypothetical protein